MIIFILILSFLIIVLIIYRVKKNKIQEIALLQVLISSNNGINFQVEVSKLNENVKSIEQVRIILNFISRIYFISRGNEENRQSIIYFLNSVVSDNNFEKTISEFKKGVSIVNKVDDVTKIKSIKATLYFQNLQNRNIYIKLSLNWYEDQIFNSIIALIVVTESQLNVYEKVILEKALRELYKLYIESYKENTLSNAKIFPNKAFMTATILPT